MHIKFAADLQPTHLAIISWTMGQCQIDLYQAVKRAFIQCLYTIYIAIVLLCQCPVRSDQNHFPKKWPGSCCYYNSSGKIHVFLILLMAVNKITP